MELDEIFETFSDGFVDIEVLRRAGKDVAMREFKKYLELAQEAERHPSRVLDGRPSAHLIQVLRRVPRIAPGRPVYSRDALAFRLRP